MNGARLNRLEEIAEGLALGFYMLMFMALAPRLLGSAGQGFLLLLAGSLAHVGRAGIEEFAAQARGAGPTPARGSSSATKRA
jgi:hypothetical protein